MSPSASSERPLLARAEELRSLGVCLEAAAAGNGNCVFVVGEAGIGKTRLLEEASALGRGLGFLVAWGRAWEAGEAPAFWPWREILRDLQAATGDAQDDLTAILDRHATVSAPAAALERVRMFETIRAFVTSTAAKAPVLLILDDLHAADPSSLVLAEHLARRLRETRVLLVGGHRDLEARRHPELAPLITRLQRTALVLHPKRLNPNQVASLVAAELGTADPETARMVHDTSDGNPLFVREIVRLVAARGRGQGSGVPAGLEAIFRERTALLAPATVALLQTAAIVGREFSLAVAAEAAGVLPEALALAVAEAEAADMVTPAAAGHCRFVHGIWTEALAQAVPLPLRERLHVRVAEALQRRHRGDPDAPLAAIAHHYLAGGIDAGPVAWRAAEAAANQADARLAFEEAARLYEAALATLAASAPADLENRLRLTLRLVGSHRRAGHAEAAWRVCQTAADWARTIARPDILAGAALTWGAEFSAGVVDPRHVAMLEEALRRLPPGDSTLRARVLARLAAAQQPAPDPTGPVAMAREAVAMVGRLSDGPARLPVLNSASAAVLCYVPPGERLALDEEVRSLATAEEDWPSVFQAQVRLAFGHIECGDTTASERAVAAVQTLADRFPQSRLRWPALLLGSMQPLFSGRFALAEVAEKQIASVLGETPDLEGERALANRTVVRMATRTDFVGLQQAVRKLRPFDPAGEAISDVIAAWGHAQAGDRSAARAGLAALAQQDIDAIFYDPSLGAVLAEIIVAAENEALAARAYDRLSVHAGRPVMLTLVGYALWDLADRVLLRLATLLRRWSEADNHAQSGQQLGARLGARPFAARLCLDWAASLRARGDDSERVLALARQAQAEGETLGMPGLVAAAREFIAADPEPAQVPVHVETATAARDGEDWAFRGAGETCRLRDCRGAQILAELLGRPGQEIHVLDLIAAGAAGVDQGDAGEILDGEARRAYQGRIAEIETELAESEAWNDVGRTATLTEEAEQIRQALAEAVGLGGRSRRAGQAAERARVNVQRRLADALRRIGNIAPSLGRHLSSSIRTGMSCSYRPESPRAPR